MPSVHHAPNHVASYVGAWIETLNDQKENQQQAVASYVGAWIETDKGVDTIKEGSRILCGCVD